MSGLLLLATGSLQTQAGVIVNIYQDGPETVITWGDGAGGAGSLAITPTYLSNTPPFGEFRYGDADYLRYFNGSLYSVYRPGGDFLGARILMGTSPTANFQNFVGTGDGFGIDNRGGTNWDYLYATNFASIKGEMRRTGLVTALNFIPGTLTIAGTSETIQYILGPPTPVNSPPIANAGVDFSVNEGQLAVALDGSGSSDPDNDPLTYAWVQVGGTTVALTGATTVSPTFTAPVVPLGGETLSFDLTVTANGETSTDNVSVTVVNVNHPPVADAGIDQTLANANAVAEGSPVTLHGEDSFDIDNDVIDFAWTQVSGPAVTLVGANTANPTFDAPYFEAGGAAGVVATLTFELLVDDGFPADAPAEGYTLANVRDTVTIEITNTNNLPVASAGPDQTVDENTSVALNGSLSSDPDADALTYAWTQIGGTPVVLSAGDTATLSFTAPFVSAGGADLEFQLSVDDGYGGSSTDNVVIHVQNANDPPLAGAAQPTIGLLWPPNHGLIAVGITGVSDPDNNATIVITSVTQDEPTNGQGDGDTAIDAIIDGESVLVRAERSGKDDGRVYHIHFTASDLEGSASGVVKVTVPQSKKKAAVDGGELFNSTE